MDFRVSFRRNAPNPLGVLRSKGILYITLALNIVCKTWELFILSFQAVGEPPLCMSYGIVLAIRDALDSARKDAGNTDVWYPLGKFYLPF